MGSITTPKISALFRTIPEFQYGLMSMLNPSDLHRFLPVIGYGMTESEKKRFMSVDREILKSTAYIDRVLKEGYHVVLVSSRLSEVYRVMRGKKVGDRRWNKQCRKLIVVPGRHTTILDGAEYRVKVMVVVYHPSQLRHNTNGETVVANPDVPVALPGTWKKHLTPYYIPGSWEYRGPCENPPKYHVSSISGAVLEEGINHDGSEDEGITGYWNHCDDIAEDCARIAFFQREPERKEKNLPVRLACIDFNNWWNRMGLVDRYGEHDPAFDSSNTSDSDSDDSGSDNNSSDDDDSDDNGGSDDERSDDIRSDDDDSDDDSDDEQDASDNTDDSGPFGDGWRIDPRYRATNYRGLEYIQLHRDPLKLMKAGCDWVPSTYGLRAVDMKRNAKDDDGEPLHHLLFVNAPDGVLELNMHIEIPLT